MMVAARLVLLNGLSSSTSQRNQTWHGTDQRRDMITMRATNAITARRMYANVVIVYSCDRHMLGALPSPLWEGWGWGSALVDALDPSNNHPHPGASRRPSPQGGG